MMLNVYDRFPYVSIHHYWKERKHDEERHIVRLIDDVDVMMMGRDDSVEALNGDPVNIEFGLCRVADLPWTVQINLDSVVAVKDFRYSREDDGEIYDFWVCEITICTGDKFWIPDVWAQKDRYLDRYEEPTE